MSFQDEYETADQATQNSAVVTLNPDVVIPQKMVISNEAYALGTAIQSLADAINKLRAQQK